MYVLPWFQRFIIPLPFAMKIIKINLWNQGMYVQTDYTSNFILDANPD
jgi:hypothetical protein